MTTKISGDNISAIANTGVTWNAVTVADGSTTLNASAGNGYFLDTNAGTIDVNLPTSPTRGDTIVIADYGNNFATNRVIINTGGKLIDSVVGGEPGTSGFKIETNGAVVELIFADDTAGWIIKQNNAPSDLGAEQYAKYLTATGGTIATSGDYKIHTFTGDGCFVVSSLGNDSGGPSVVDYLVVAGGGGIGSTNRTGGGGGGGVRASSGTSSGCYTAGPLGACVPGVTVSLTTYPITVGAGGASASATGEPTGVRGGNGSNSIFSTITSAGGGGSGTVTAPPYTNMNGNPGGSGGGGAAGNSQNSSGGTGNTPPTSPPQGQPGGNGVSPSSNFTGGGGGATEAGVAGTTGTAGRGGAGLTNSITGSAVGYGGGGGGVYCSPSGTTGAASPCGSGGVGVSTPLTAGTDAVANRGGGGGGRRADAASSPALGGNGGKGIVIIRYKFQN